MKFVGKAPLRKIKEPRSFSKPNNEDIVNSASVTVSQILQLETKADRIEKAGKEIEKPWYMLSLEEIMEQRHPSDLKKSEAIETKISLVGFGSSSKPRISRCVRSDSDQPLKPSGCTHMDELAQLKQRRLRERELMDEVQKVDEQIAVLQKFRKKNRFLLHKMLEELDEKKNDLNETRAFGVRLYQTAVEVIRSNPSPPKPRKTPTVYPIWEKQRLQNIEEKALHLVELYDRMEWVRLAVRRGFRRLVRIYRLVCLKNIAGLGVSVGNSDIAAEILQLLSSAESDIPLSLSLAGQNVAKM